MFHVPDDKRARRSAAKLYETLLTLMEQEDLSKITIQQLTKASGVSRMTFHRLFDSIDDILYFKCDEIFTQILKEFNYRVPTGPKAIQHTIEHWLEHERLIRLLDEQKRLSILFQLFSQKDIVLELLFSKSSTLERKDLDYLISILSVWMPAVLKVWIRHDKKESPKEIFEHLQNVVNIMDAAFNQEGQIKVEAKTDGISAGECKGDNRTR